VRDADEHLDRGVVDHLLNDEPLERQARARDPVGDLASGRRCRRRPVKTEPHGAHLGLVDDVGAERLEGDTTTDPSCRVTGVLRCTHPFRSRGRDPVAGEQPLDLVGGEPSLIATGERACDHRHGLVGPEVGEVRHRARRPLAPPAVVGRVRHRDGGLLGEGEGRDPRAALDELLGEPLRRHPRGRDRDRAVDRSDRLRNTAADLGGVCRLRRDVDHDHRVDVRIGGDRRDRAAVVLGARARDHVDGVRHARLLGKERAQLLAGRLRQRVHVQAVRLARVGAQDPEPTGVRDDRDAVALRRRLVREQRRDIEHLLERVGPDHARLPEQGVDRDVRCGEECTRV
jgi:hypothetical protein